MHEECPVNIREQPVHVKSPRKECARAWEGAESQGLEQWFCQFKIMAVGVFSSLSPVHTMRGFSSALLSNSCTSMRPRSPALDLSSAWCRARQRRDLACPPFLRVNRQGLVNVGEGKSALNGLGFQFRCLGGGMLLIKFLFLGQGGERVMQFRHNSMDPSAS